MNTRTFWGVIHIRPICIIQEPPIERIVVYAPFDTHSEALAFACKHLSKFDEIKIQEIANPVHGK